MNNNKKNYQDFDYKPAMGLTFQKGRMELLV